MKITRFALAAKCGAFGFRSYVRSFARLDSAANILSCCSMEFTAIAPNPTAASCNACLRVKIFFMAYCLHLRSVTIKEVVCPKHRLDEQAEAFLRIGFRCDGFLRDLLFFRSRWPVVGEIECDLDSFVVIIPAL